MKLHDGAGLFAKLEKAGLADKTIRDFSIDDIFLLTDILAEHLDGDAPPRWHNGQLVIPINAPRKYRYWQRTNLPDKEKYQLWLELGVQPEDMHKYMHQRAIDVALGKCDESGNKKL